MTSNRLYKGIFSIFPLFISDVVFAKEFDIEWEIMGRFRLIKDPAAEAKLYEIAQLAPLLQCAISKDEKCVVDGKTKSEILGAFNAIAPNGHEEFFAAMPKSAYKSETGLYEAGYAHMPTQWKIEFRLAGIPSPADSACQWLLDGAAVSGATDCRVFRPSMPVASASLITLKVDGKEVVNVRPMPTDILVVGMGDSYGSGEGMPDVNFVKAGAKAQWLDEKCHRSLLSAQSLAAVRLALEDKHRSVTFVTRACSGAEIAELHETVPPAKDIDLRGHVKKIAYRVEGGNPTTHIRPQLSALTADLCTTRVKLNADCPAALNDSTPAFRQPDLVLLSVGGNDGKFFPMILNTVLTTTNQPRTTDLNLHSIKLRGIGLANVWARFPLLAQAMLDKQRGFPIATIIHVGYPNPLKAQGELGYCPAKELGGEEYANIMSETGVVSRIASLFKRRGTQREYIALSDDFVTPLTGSTAEDPAKAEDKGVDRFGLRQIDIALTCIAGQPGGVGPSIPVSAGALRTLSRSAQCLPYWQNSTGFNTFDLGRWRYSLSRNVKDDIPMEGFIVHGFCNKAAGVSGRWFNVLGDSQKYLGNFSGAIHPNIYGQLFLANRAWVAIPHALRDSAQIRVTDHSDQK